MRLRGAIAKTGCRKDGTMDRKTIAVGGAASQKSVLIIGGGFAGLTAAQTLLKSRKYTVTLVDRKEYFEVTPAQIHQLVAPDSLGDRPRFHYREVLGENFVLGEVVRLEDNVAVLAQGQRLSFDILILSPGTRYPRLPLAKPTDDVTLGQRRDTVMAENRKFQAAKSYLIVGGGLVGVELAGEIASSAPGKSIRLAHRGSRLVENLSSKASSEALTQLQALGVKVLLNTADASPAKDELVYDATTPKPATGFLASGQPEILDTRGQIVVNERFQVKGHASWYAVGDATDAPHSKQAVVAATQGGYVAKVLLGLTKPFHHRPLVAFVPLGSKLGFTQLPFGVVRWKFMVNMKRKNYLVELIRKQIGAA